MFYPDWDLEKPEDDLKTAKENVDKLKSGWSHRVFYPDIGEGGRDLEEDPEESEEDDLTTAKENVDKLKSGLSDQAEKLKSEGKKLKSQMEGKLDEAKGLKDKLFKDFGFGGLQKGEEAKPKHKKTKKVKTNKRGKTTININSRKYGKKGDVNIKGKVLLQEDPEDEEDEEEDEEDEEDVGFDLFD